MLGAGRAHPGGAAQADEQRSFGEHEAHRALCSFVAEKIARHAGGVCGRTFYLRLGPSDHVGSRIEKKGPAEQGVGR